MRFRVLVLCLLAAAVTVLSNGAVSAQTTVPGESTTAAPPSTDAPTTVAPTTTLAPATTTTPSTTPSSSTTASTTPTTVAPTNSSSGSSSTPWIILIVALAVLAIGLIIVLVRMRQSRNRAEHAWRADAARTGDNAALARSMLDDEARPGEIEDATHRATVRDRVEAVAASLDRLAATAPDDSGRQSATNAAESLRGLAFAHEAERLLREAPTPPTADQLAGADHTRRTRAGELDAALARLRERAHVDDATR